MYNFNVPELLFFRIFFLFCHVFLFFFHFFVLPFFFTPDKTKHRNIKTKAMRCSRQSKINTKIMQQTEHAITKKKKMEKNEKKREEKHRNGRR